MLSNSVVVIEHLKALHYLTWFYKPETPQYLQMLQINKLQKKLKKVLKNCHYTNIYSNHIFPTCSFPIYQNL